MQLFFARSLKAICLTQRREARQGNVQGSASFAPLREISRHRLTKIAAFSTNLMLKQKLIRVE